MQNKYAYIIKECWAYNDINSKFIQPGEVFKILNKDCYYSQFANWCGNIREISNNAYIQMNCKSPSKLIKRLYG